MYVQGMLVTYFHITPETGQVPDTEILVYLKLHVIT